MAKSKAPQANPNVNEADDLLVDGQPEDQLESAETATTDDENEIVEFNGEKMTKKQLAEKIKELQDMVKTAKAVSKGEKPKTARTVKGVMVAFKNKAGDIITGPGVTYYVARHGGKLHYKEASQVILLPEGWKEGDPIDFSSIEKAAETEEKA